MKLYPSDLNDRIERPNGPSKSGTKPSPPSAIPSLRLLFTALVAVLGGAFHFGYQIAVINPMADVLEQFIRDAYKGQNGEELSETAMTWAWSIITGILFLGATLGAWIASSAVNRLGPTRTLLISAPLLVLSETLAGSSRYISSIVLFVIGRAIAGIGVGVGMTASGVLLSEISPVRHRGLIGSFAGFSSNIGYFLASALGISPLLGTEDRWPFAYFGPAAACFVATIFLSFACRESPVFLLRKGDVRAAEESIATYAPRDPVEERVAEICAELESKPRVATWSEVYSDRASWKACWLSMVLNATISFSGVVALSSYGSLMLQDMGFSELNAGIANAAGSLIGVIGAIVGSLTVEKAGRRALVISSLGSLALLNGLMMATALVYERNNRIAWLRYAFFAAFFAFKFMFSIGAGPSAYFIGAELAPAESRARVQSAAIGAQYITCFLSPIIHYPLKTYIGAFSFLLFIVPLCASTFCFYRCLPETRARTAEQIARALRGEREIEEEETA